MARITQQSSIHTTGTSYENEPIIKSDGASSNVMQWLSNNEASNVTISEDASNNLDLVVSAGNVGVGVAAPRVNLHVNDSTATSEDCGIIQISNYDTSFVDTTPLGILQFGGTRNNTNWGVGASISAEAAEAWDATNELGTDLLLKTCAIGSASLTTRLSISNNGVLTTNGDTGAGYHAIEEDGTLSGFFGSGNALSAGDTGAVTDLAVRAVGNLALCTNNAAAAKMVISTTGLATFSNGIALDDGAGVGYIAGSTSIVTVADTSTTTVTISGGALVQVYVDGTGGAGLFYAIWGSATVTELSDINGWFGTTQGADDYNVYKASGTHLLTIENNSGVSRGFRVMVQRLST